jgi:hypothetical protein
MDCFEVCFKCKWCSTDWWDVHGYCEKCYVVKNYPEGVTSKFYKNIVQALDELREQNGGACPYFERRIGTCEKLCRWIFRK